MTRLHIFLYCAFALCLASCVTTDEEAVRNVAQHYLDATANYNIDDAYDYASSETCEALDIIENKLLPNLDPTYIASNTPAKVTVTTVSFENDSVAHAVYHKKTPIKEYTDTLALIKRDGKWLAYVKIELPSVLDTPNYSADSANARYERYKGQVMQRRPEVSPNYDQAKKGQSR